VTDLERLAGVLRRVLPGSATSKIREVRQILAAERILGGEPATQVAADLKLQRRGVEALVEQVTTHGLAGFPFLISQPAESDLAKRRLGIAQMLLAELAERRFETVIQEVTGPGVLRTEDHRPSRTDTDYRLLNGNNEPICRFNIKFHGSLFREARRFVNLDPEDCFALATYKINNALRRQAVEKLPYIFLVLSVPDLNASEVEQLVPDDLVWTVAVLGGKMAVEEAIVSHLLDIHHLPRFQPILEKMPAGQFRVISAAKAEKLLRDKLFERVHALSLKGFTRKFRNAEVDMHLSLSQELTPVQVFLEVLVKDSHQRFAVRLYTGEF